MIKKLSIGNRFLILELFVFILFLYITHFEKQKIIHLTLDQNMPVLTYFVGLFFLIQVILYVIFFRKELFKEKLSLNDIVMFSLLSMLIFTVLSEVIARYITGFFVGAAVVYGLLKKQFKIHPLFYFIVAYYIFQLIGLLWSIDFGLGFKFIGKGLSYILLPLAFSFIFITNEDRNKLLRIFFRFLIVYALMVLISYLYQVYFHEKDILVGLGLKKRYFDTQLLTGNDYSILLGWGGYDHPTFISFILSLMYGVGFYLWKTEKHLSFRITTSEMIVFTIIASAVIVFLQSRIGMIFFPVGVFLSVLLYVRKRKKIVAGIIALTVIGLILMYIFVVKNHSEYFSDQPRMKQTEIMISYIKNHYWTGTGTGGMSIINVGYPAGHNQILGEIFHLGIPGFAVFCLLIGASVYYAIKDKNLILLYFLILYFLLMQIDMALAYQKGITYFALFACLFVRPAFNNKNL